MYIIVIYLTRKGQNRTGTKCPRDKTEPVLNVPKLKGRRKWEYLAKYLKVTAKKK